MGVAAVHPPFAVIQNSVSFFFDVISEAPSTQIDTPGQARGPNSITAPVGADLNPGVLEAQHSS